jgi:glycerol-3-phosphate dehydrogenase
LIEVIEDRKNFNEFREVHVFADILIIGGGSAGSMTAIRAKELQPD